MTEERFVFAPESWALPLTALSNRWQQDEYLECRKCGFLFYAEEFEGVLLWHYQLPTSKGWAYPTVEFANNRRIQANKHPRNPFDPDNPFRSLRK